MKILMTLSVLQTIGIALLVIYTLRSTSDGASAMSGRDISNSDTAAIVSVADENRLRTIIRQELAALPLQANTRSAPSASGVLPRNEAQDAERQQRVAQQIDAYASAGSITDDEMEQLQLEIAQLDAPSRKQMMSKLIRALNSGELKGRL